MQREHHFPVRIAKTTTQDDKKLICMQGIEESGRQSCSLGEESATTMSEGRCKIHMGLRLRGRDIETKI